MSRGTAWSRKEDDIMRAAWPTEETVEQIGIRLDRSVVALYSRARVLRLPQKYVERAARIDSMGRVIDVYSRIEETPVCDDEYVEACLAQGGFWAFSERRGIRGHVAVCLPMLPPPGASNYAAGCAQIGGKPVSWRERRSDQHTPAQVI